MQNGSGTNEQLLLQQQLRDLTCPQYFHSCNTSVFKLQLSRLLHSVVIIAGKPRRISSNQQTCSRQSTYSADTEYESFVNHDAGVIQKFLFYSTDHDHITQCKKKSHTSTQNTSIGASNYSSIIQWEELCQEHEHTFLRNRTTHGEKKLRTSKTSPKTALDIILETILDSPIIPPCFSEVIVLGLMQIYIEVGSANTSLSTLERKRKFINLEGPEENSYDGLASQRLLQSIMQVMRRTPLTFVTVPQEAQNYLNESILQNMRLSYEDRSVNIQSIRWSIDLFNVQRSLIAVSLVRDLACLKLIRSQHRIASTISLSPIIALEPILCLLREIDEIDVKMITGQCSHKLFKKKGIKKQRLLHQVNDLSDVIDEQCSKSIRTSTADELHESFDTGVPKIRKQSSVYNEMLSDMLKSSKKISYLPLPLIRFRANLYETILKIGFSFISPSSAHYTSSTSNLLIRPFEYMLDMVVKESHSSSLRLCAILYANLFNGGYQVMLEKLRSFFMTLHDSESLHGAAKIYAETVVQCKYFDDPNSCFNSVKALFETLIAVDDDLQLKMKNASSFEQNSLRRSLLLTCVGYILMEKRTVLERLVGTAKDCFDHYITMCSVRFCDASLWFHWINQRQHNELMCTLQIMGIVGFVDDTFPTTTAKLDGDVVEWPFVERNTALEAFKRMGHVKCENPFSVEKEKNPSVKAIPSQKLLKESNTSNEAIHDYLNEDLMREVFSFLTYRKVIQISGVSKMWNILCNENSLWKMLLDKRFKTRYPTYCGPCCKPISDSFQRKYGEKKERAFKSLFQERYKKTRYIRGNCNDQGFMWKLCNFVDCFVTFKNVQQMKAHLEKHDRDMAKNISALTRAEERRVQRTKQKNEKKRGKGTVKVNPV